MKCQSVFTGKNKKTIPKCCLLKLLSHMLSIKGKNLFLGVVRWVCEVEGDGGILFEKGDNYFLVSVNSHGGVSVSVTIVIQEMSDID